VYGYTKDMKFFWARAFRVCVYLGFGGILWARSGALSVLPGWSGAVPEASVLPPMDSRPGSSGARDGGIGPHSCCGASAALCQASLAGEAFRPLIAG